MPHYGVSQLAMPPRFVYERDILWCFFKETNLHWHRLNVVKISEAIFPSVVRLVDIIITQGRKGGRGPCHGSGGACSTRWGFVV